MSRMSKLGSIAALALVATLGTACGGGGGSGSSATAAGATVDFQSFVVNQFDRTADDTDPIQTNGINFANAENLDRNAFDAVLD